MDSDLEEILNYQPGGGSYTRIGRSPDGSIQVQQFSQASGMGCVVARSKYRETFGKHIPNYVDQFHPVIIAKLCGYACKVGVDLETLLMEVKPSHDN